MPARRRSRQHALQVLFAWDQRKQPVEEAIADFYGTLDSEDEPAETPRGEPSREPAGDPALEPRCPRDEFMESLVRGVVASAADIDQRIVARSENWRLERMSAVDRSILRLAIYEMTGIGTPPPVVIDEALELARRFSGDESVAFINGVLDAVRKDAQL